MGGFLMSILAESIATAKTTTAAANDKVVQPKTITQADAMDAANCRYQINQAVIGAKEGAAEAIIAKAGKAITDTRQTRYAHWKRD